MAGNRVEELETKVRELEASVSGLTDELVETKERLQHIEEQMGPELDGIVEGKSSRRQARSDQQDRAQASSAETEESPEQADEQPAADEAKADETEGEDESSEASDDIIVA